MQTESSAPDALVIQLLAWIAARRRLYGETMDAWHTSCPRLPVWEDAVDAGLVEVVGGRESGMANSEVRLTHRGQERLRANGG